MHWFLTFCFLCLVLSQHNDLVTNLIPEYQHPWYSGYLNISQGKSIHYIFFQSQHDSDNDPIILWLGSDLGCSSISSMVEQNGPFIFNKNNTQYSINKNSWNRQANLIYIDPLGSVGFSIGAGANTDASVAVNIRQAIATFLSHFPKLRNNNLFLSGSGYVGTIAPFAAQQIYNYNSHQSTHIKINLKGLFLGNPCTHGSQCYSSGTDGISYRGLQFLYKRTFYTQQQFLQIKAACSWDFSSESCFQTRSKFEASFKKYNTSSSNIYQPCYYEEDHYGDLRCQDHKGADAFFNNAQTQLQLHVFQAGIEWKVCNHQVGYKYKGNQNGSYPLYNQLMKHYQIWLFSGDLSADIPLTSTIHWMQQFRQQFHVPVYQPWREWWIQGLHSHQDQVGGMVWKLRNLTLVTVRSGGFYASRDQPIALQTIVDNYLKGTNLPRKQEQ